MDRVSVERLLLEIGESLREKLTLYLLGGGAMVLRGLKPETVDLDFITEKYEDSEVVAKILKKLGFRERLAGARFERQRGGLSERVETDVGGFLGTPLTDGARSRGDVRKFGNLEIQLLANEDVFLFKAVTGRYKDMGDISKLASAGVDWDVILDEAVKMRQIGVSKVSPGIVAVTLRHLGLRKHIVEKFEAADKRVKKKFIYEHAEDLKSS